MPVLQLYGITVKMKFLHTNKWVCSREFLLVSEGRGNMFKRNGKYFIYLPVRLAEDSMFPFLSKGEKSMHLKVSFKKNKLIVEEWNEASTKKE